MRPNLYPHVARIVVTLVWSTILATQVDAAETAVQASTTTTPPKAAVIPVRGTVSGNELKAVAKEVREQLRYHGYRLSTQKEVRQAIQTTAGKTDATLSHLGAVAKSLDTELVLVPVVIGSDTAGFVLGLISFNPESGSLWAVQARLPRRGAGSFTQRQVSPAAAACVASLLFEEPSPVLAPFPQVVQIDPYAALNIYGLRSAQKRSSTETPPPDMRLERRELEKGTTLPPVETPPEKTAMSEGEGPRSELLQEPEEEPKYDWTRWDHKGFFLELGFLFSWCRGEVLCDGATSGYGGRLRIGYRIFSYVAISVSGVAVDHKMPLTTDMDVFLDVNSAFVRAGVFGGIRFHPVRYFVVDPFVGLDLGTLWYLHASNKSVAMDPSEIPAGVPQEVVDKYLSARRSTTYLRGFTVAPELGVNFFVAPSTSLGIHAQWTFPFWGKACVRVSDPANPVLMENPQVCSRVKNIATNNAMDPISIQTLSNKENLPRFIQLELNLSFVFH